MSFQLRMIDRDIRLQPSNKLSHTNKLSPIHQLIFESPKPFLHLPSTNMYLLVHIPLPAPVSCIVLSSSRAAQIENIRTLLDFPETLSSTWCASSCTRSTTCLSLRREHSIVHGHIILVSSPWRVWISSGISTWRYTCRSCCSRLGTLLLPLHRLLLAIPVVVIVVVMMTSSVTVTIIVVLSITTPTMLLLMLKVEKRDEGLVVSRPYHIKFVFGFSHTTHIETRIKSRHQSIINSHAKIHGWGSDYSSSSSQPFYRPVVTDIEIGVVKSCDVDASTKIRETFGGEWVAGCKTGSRGEGRKEKGMHGIVKSTIVDKCALSLYSPSHSHRLSLLCDALEDRFTLFHSFTPTHTHQKSCINRRDERTKIYDIMYGNILGG